MKRKVLAILVLLLLLCSFAFAKEGDTRVTRTDTTRFSFDCGAGIRLPLQGKGDTSKKGLVYCELTITPFSYKSVGLGFKTNLTVAGGKDVLNGGGGVKDRIKRTETAFSVLFSGTISLAKSFEAYGGLGPGYILFDIKGKSSFKQAVGAVIEAGGRGRINNHIGCGVQFDFFQPITKNGNRFADVKLYLSVEL